jgi:hypothetical protein
MSDAKSVLFARLAFVRLTLQQSVHQAGQPHPMSALAILTAHDAVDLYLQLACSTLSITPKSDYLMGQLDALEAKGIAIPLKAEVKRLNEMRNILKHKGIMPSQFDIESIVSHAHQFITDLAPTIFGARLEQATSLELVQCEAVRAILREAQAASSSGQYEIALSKAMIAFYELMRDHDQRASSTFGRSPFAPGEYIPYLSSEIEEEFCSKYPKLLSEIESLVVSYNDIQTTMRVLTVGINYKKYLRFRVLCPTLSMNEAGKIVADSGKRTKLPTPADIAYCIDFVIESALQLQSLDLGLLYPNEARKEALTGLDYDIPRTLSGLSSTLP